MNAHNAQIKALPVDGFILSASIGKSLFLCGNEKIMSEIVYGYCHCGCGKITSVAPKTITRKGYKKGVPVKYLPGHSSCGEKHSNWKGGKRIDTFGYVQLWDPKHSRSSNTYVREHIVLAEKALGKPLPEGAQVHHVNQKKADNGGGNIVICQDDAYHKLIEKRARALQACGHATWLKCPFCKQYDNPTKMFLNAKGYAYHRKCSADYRRNLTRNKSRFIQESMQ